jgi:hypothetical protein
VYEECTKKSFDGKDYGFSSESLVDLLIEMIDDFRYVTHLEMSMTNQCSMSVDFAFSVAFRRLPKEVAVEITKALAIRISTLIDSLKQDSILSNKWTVSIDKVVDLIQVIECCKNNYVL